MGLKTSALALGLMATAAHAQIPTDMPWEQAKGYAIAHDATYSEKCYAGQGFCGRTLEWRENAYGKGVLTWSLRWAVTPDGQRYRETKVVDRMICAEFPGGQRMVCAEYSNPSNRHYYRANSINGDWDPE